MNRYYKEFFLVLGVLFVTFVLFFPKQLFGGHVFYASDNFNLMTPTRIFLAHELSEGRFPLWNPYILSGTPFFADINNAALNITNSLFLISSPFKALTLAILFDYIVAFIGMYLLLRLLTVRILSALCGAVLFTFSGSLAVYTDNIASLHTAVWAPLVIGLWIYYFQKRSYSTFIFCVISVSLQIISGHPQMTYYTILASVAYSLCISKGLFIHKILLNVLIILTALLLTSIQLIPFIELAKSASRSVLGSDYATGGSLNPLYTIRFFLPRLVGIKPLGTQLIQDGNIFGYIGIVPFFIIFFIRRWDRNRIFFAGLVIISLLISFGKYTPFYWISYWLIPGFSLFRIPQQILLLYTISLCTLTAFGIEECLKKDITICLKRLLLRFSIIMMGVGILLWVCKKWVAETAVSMILPFAAEKVIQKLALPGHTVTEGIVGYVRQNFILIGLMVACFVIWQAYLRKHVIWSKAIVLLLFVDLLIIVPPTIHSLPESDVMRYLYLGQQTVRSMKMYNPDLDRIFIPVPFHQAPRIKAYGLANDYEEELWQAIILRPNVNMYFGVSALDGYTPTIWIPYQQHFDESTYLPTSVSIPENRNDLIASASGKYIIGAHGSVIIQSSARPKIFLIDKKGSMQKDGYSIDIYNSNTIHISTNVSERTQLIILDSNYPGWTVTVDGERASIIPFEKIFKSVFIAGGHHTVVFSYIPVTVRIGLTISITTMCILFGLPLFLRGRYLGNN